MKPIRVLVVDDSVVVRRLVVGVLEEDADIEVVGTAANGRIALDKLDALSPDIVTLDIEMPEMDGLETLRALRKRFPRLPVVMFSTLTERGAIATLDALARGANDFVTKPANVGSVTEGMAAIRDELIPKLKGLCGRRITPAAGTAVASAAPVPGAAAAVTTSRPVATGPTAATRPAPAPAHRGATVSGPAPSTAAPAAARVPAGGPVKVVVIGVSTGGPNALAAIWAALPRLRVPILIVQHMPPVFTTMLARRLGALGTVPVSEATDGCDVVAGKAWLAPGDHHLVLERGTGGVHARINQAAPENSCRPAVDPLFRSAADLYGSGVLAVVLTGMGSDGLRGAQVIHDAGGSVLAQDEATSVVWGMPGAVAHAGLADAIVPLDRVAAEIAARAGSPTAHPAAVARRPVGVP